MRTNALENAADLHNATASMHMPCDAQPRIVTTETTLALVVASHHSAMIAPPAGPWTLFMLRAPRKHLKTSSRRKRRPIPRYSIVSFWQDVLEQYR